MDMNTEKDEIFIQVKSIGFTFLLDKSLNIPAVIRQESFNRITKIVMKMKQETQHSSSSNTYCDK